jgi:hypothetical protein
VPLLEILFILAAWGILALFLLLLALARARRVYLPVPRDESKAVFCRRCRLPFHRASWRCGRCGAPLKFSLFYLIGRFLLEPLLGLIILPWILLFGGIISLKLWFAQNLLPGASGFLERIARRLGVWITPLFGRWVPRRWQIPSKGTRLLPAEADVPPDVMVASVLTLAVSLLQEAEEEVQVHIPSPAEPTLDLLRHTEDGIREVWGYVPDGRPLVPSYTDRIIAAEITGSELMEFVEGIDEHLEVPLNRVEVLPAAGTGSGEKEGAPGAPGGPKPAARPTSWSILLLREPPETERYPIHCEIIGSPETVQQVRRRLAELSQWNSLPCGLVLA